MRRSILKLHLLLSLFLGIFIVSICTTGSLLVVQADIEKLIYPQLYHATPGNTPIHTIRQNAEQAYPGFKADRLDMPGEDGLYHVRVTKEIDGKASTHTVYVNPGNGDVLGLAGPERNLFFTKVLQLHRYLLVGDLLGKPKASIIAGCMGLGLILILLTGAYLWWPGLKKFASGLRMIRNKGKLIINQGMHKIVGIITIPFLLVFAVSGTAFQLDKYIFGWFGVSTRVEVPSSWSKTKTSQSELLSLEKIVQNAQEEFPTAQLMRIQFPLKPDQTYQLVMKEGYSPTGLGNITVYEDPYTGQILGHTNPFAGMNLYTAWRRGLHFATWGGEPVKYLSFIIGMMPLFLMITGLTIWQLKARARRKKKKSAGSKPLPAPVPVPVPAPSLNTSE